MSPYDRMNRCYWFASKVFDQSEFRYVNYPIKIEGRSHKIGHVVVDPYPSSIYVTSVIQD